MKKFLILIFGVSQLSMSAQYSLVWSDEFNGTGLPDAAKWGYEVGMVRNHEAQYYTNARTENARQEGGNLVIESRKETYQSASYTSASVITKGKAGWLYGRFEVRAQLPPGQGMWPAIWLMPVTNTYGGWPSSGEIDMMENFYPRGSNYIFSTIHTESYNWVKGTSRGSKLLVADPHTHYYTYTMEWYPSRIDLYVDTNLVYSFFKESSDYKVWPFNKPFYFILNAAIGGDAGGMIDNSIFPTKMYVDYARVYQMPNVAGDVTAPSKPINLKYQVSGSTLRLSWDKATDNIGGIIYEVYKNDVKIGTTVKSTYSLTIGLDTSYVFKIRALDGSANAATSDTIQYTGINDTQAPTVPANLRSAGSMSNSVSLIWDASTDNVGVKSYEIYKDGVWAGSVAYPSYTLTGLTSNTSYTITVAAKDKKGNLSAVATVAVRTKIGAALQTETDADVAIFPNPVGDVIHARFNTGFTEARVYSPDGKLILNASVAGSIEADLDAESLSPGIYYILFTGISGNIVVKHIVRF